MAIMVLCMPASTVNLDCANSAVMRLPIPYTPDDECHCDSNGCIGGVWLNYYSPCRCGSTTVVLSKPLLLPPLRENLEDFDTQLHRILHPSVYTPSLNPGFFSALSRHILEIHPPDPLDFLDHSFLSSGLEYEPFDTTGFLDTSRFSRRASTVPEPTTLTLLAIGAIVVSRRRTRSA